MLAAKAIILEPIWLGRGQFVSSLSLPKLFQIRIEMAGAVGCSFCGHVGLSTLDDVKVGQDLVMWPELTKKQKREKLKTVSDKFITY